MKQAAFLALIKPFSDRSTKQQYQPHKNFLFLTFSLKQQNIYFQIFQVRKRCMFMRAQACFVQHVHLAFLRTIFMPISCQVKSMQMISFTSYFLIPNGNYKMIGSSIFFFEQWKCQFGLINKFTMPKSIDIRTFNTNPTIHPKFHSISGINILK